MKKIIFIVLLIFSVQVSANIYRLVNEERVNDKKICIGDFCASKGNPQILGDQNIRDNCERPANYYRCKIMTETNRGYIQIGSADFWLNKYKDEGTSSTGQLDEDGVHYIIMNAHTSTVSLKRR